MKRLIVVLTVLLSVYGIVESAQPSYSTGAVGSYMANCGVGPDLPWCVFSASNFRCWYDGGIGCFPFPFGFPFGGFGTNNFPLVTAWNDGDVWGSDFRDGNGTADSDPSGGSDIPRIYFYNGHGICQGTPAATDPDYIIVCGNFGKPDLTDVGASSRWGSTSAGGKLQFAFIDASCPMDLVSIGNNWFPVFSGLHVAIGHSGDATHDTLNSPDRGGAFAAYTAGNAFFLPQLSVGDAWMTTGLIDVQSGTCAVAIAAGATEAECIDRRENERVTDGRSDPVPNWFGWMWVCN
jgi:hypothetical protein